MGGASLPGQWIIKWIISAPSGSSSARLQLWRSAALRIRWQQLSSRSRITETPAKAPVSNQLLDPGTRPRGYEGVGGVLMIRGPSRTDRLLQTRLPHDAEGLQRPEPRRWPAPFITVRSNCRYNMTLASSQELSNRSDGQVQTEDYCWAPEPHRHTGGTTIGCRFDTELTGRELNQRFSVRLKFSFFSGSWEARTRNYGET